jgi:hypothetical protein
VLDSEEDLFLMNLTRIAEDPAVVDLSRAEQEAVCDEIEMLLEYFVLAVNQYVRPPLVTTH